MIKTLIVFFSLISSIASAQDYYGVELRERWLLKAEKSKPQLSAEIKKPKAVVKLIEDQNSFQGWKAEKVGAISDFYEKSFKSQSSTVIDFGEHLTGYFTFSIKASQNALHGPLRLKLIFGEVPAELATPFDPYPGTLSRAWLQDEIVTLTELPAKVALSRRMSFRYLKIELLASPSNFDFKISDIQFKSVTSVVNRPDSLSSSASPMIVAIDKVGLSTLKECMQTVYEDGPKRDRRLWTGDLYLEALANAYSFKNHDLTKRCLYLLAGVSKPSGFLYPCVFEAPEPHTQEGGFLFEYSLLYNAALKEYVIATNDKETGLDLWPVAKRQVENISKHLDANGLLNTQRAERDGWWLFVDWREGLEKQASVQGIMIFSIQETLALAKLLGKENEVAYLKELETRMTKAARTLYNKESGLFLSGSAKQVSFASQCWMIISGVASKAEAQSALKAIAIKKDAVKPGTPYLMHYYITALIKCGLNKEAKSVMEDYWGGMVKKGADTFWEAYDPDNEKLSPYNFFPINSYCHAWSCTPVYFIRKYPAIFQK
ncbi:alpha-L-rhamnosidase-related protein [Pedobacter metabolipauper]|uniref:Alpha-L-rhamnosidase-like protein n=1 Tax=Pedobacter metabolipauper TaxID=425513 RepID=A0A4R6SW72_9SPHI|nr:family 78 glycoside hydrolase catalytic domain [Pedobacter metabolipauper]TDQ08669.1 alpha-L-rhamnosidase-like protein [Pedobacter metabolipauper]